MYKKNKKIFFASLIFHFIAKMVPYLVKIGFIGGSKISAFRDRPLSARESFDDAHPVL